MNTKVKYIIPIAILIFLVSVVGVSAQMENLRADYDSKLAEYVQAKTDYLKVKGLSANDKQRVEGARNVLNTSLKSVTAYMNMFKSKLDSISPATGEVVTANLNGKYDLLTNLNKKVLDAKSLDDLKTCLNDTKSFWAGVLEDCKYVQTRWMLFQTNEAYNKLNQVATELNTFVTSDELTKTKETLMSSNNDFKIYYSQVINKSEKDMNSGYSDIQQSVTNFSKILGDSETSLGNVIQKASE